MLAVIVERHCRCILAVADNEHIGESHLSHHLQDAAPDTVGQPPQTTANEADDDAMEDPLPVRLTNL